MGHFAKKIQKTVTINDPSVVAMKKRISMLVDMQISALQTKIDILNKCKSDANKADDMVKLMKVYQDLVEMVQSDNISNKPSGESVSINL